MRNMPKRTCFSDSRFAKEMQAFPHIEDIPLVASPGNSRRNEIAGLTGSDPEKKWILLSFTTLDWDGGGSGKKSSALQEYEFFTVRPLGMAAEEIFTPCIAGK